MNGWMDGWTTKKNIPVYKKQPKEVHVKTNLNMWFKMCVGVCTPCDNPCCNDS